MYANLLFIDIISVFIYAYQCRKNIVLYCTVRNKDIDIVEVPKTYTHVIDLEIMRVCIRYFCHFDRVDICLLLPVIT